MKTNNDSDVFKNGNLLDGKSASQWIQDYKKTEWEVSYYPGFGDRLKVVRGFPSEAAAKKWAKAENLIGPNGTADDLTILPSL